MASTTMVCDEGRHDACQGFGLVRGDETVHGEVVRTGVWLHVKCSCLCHRPLVDPAWAIDWFKTKHLAWARGDGQASTLGFNEWIDAEWAAVLASRGVTPSALTPRAEAER